MARPAREKEPPPTAAELLLYLLMFVIGVTVTVVSIWVYASIL